MTDAAWTRLAAAPQPTLEALFAAEPDRLERLSLTEAGIHFDFARTHLSDAVLSAFLRLAEETGLAARRDALFAGAIVNPTEGRAAEHTAERGQGAPESVARAQGLHARMRALVDAVEAEAFARFDPHTTLVAIASKTFTTTETMLNAASAMQWLEEAGVDDAWGRLVALTAAPERAIEWGVDETRILPFAESIGGRYDDHGVFFGTRWINRIECEEGQDEGAMTGATKSEPSEREVALLGALVGNVMTRL